MDGSGVHTCRQLSSAGIPCTLVLDSAAAYMMERVDVVLVGAEAVVESGGIINHMGTFQARSASRLGLRCVLATPNAVGFKSFRGQWVGCQRHLAVHALERVRLRTARLLRLASRAGFALVLCEFHAVQWPGQDKEMIPMVSSLCDRRVRVFERHLRL